VYIFFAALVTICYPRIIYNTPYIVCQEKSYAWILSGEERAEVAAAGVVLEEKELYAVLELYRIKEAMRGQLERIFKEGDRRKIEAVKAQLAALDPQAPDT
jgi:hypothetical protein